MVACVEVTPWERQPREGEEAYTAFLAYRDLGPGRTHEATRKGLSKRPGYLKPIERWSSLRDWRRRAGDWDAHLQAERDKVAAEEAAKWERRRLQALEEGWQLCQSLRAKLAEMLAFPLETPVVARSVPAEETQAVIAEAVSTPEEGKTPAVRGKSRWDYTTVGRLSKLVHELEWALLNQALPGPEGFDPLTATMEEFEAYMASYSRRVRPPPR